jgi:hypothetical protein
MSSSGCCIPKSDKYADDNHHEMLKLNAKLMRATRAATHIGGRKEEIKACTVTAAQITIILRSLMITSDAADTT